MMKFKLELIIIKIDRPSPKKENIITFSKPPIIDFFGKRWLCVNVNFEF